MERTCAWLQTRWLTVAALCLTLPACTPFGDCSATGTNKFAGSWIKTSGYSPPRTPAELETNYDLLIIEPGDRMCEAGISNTVSTGANYRALYTINVLKKTVSVQYDENNQPAPDATPTVLKYFFPDSCDGTKLGLRYPTGQTETFKLYNPEVEVGSCDP